MTEKLRLMRIQEKVEYQFHFDFGQLKLNQKARMKPFVFFLVQSILIWSSLQGEDAKASSSGRLWTALSKVKVNQIYGENLPLELLPNPEYHGMERATYSDTQFMPQEDCNFVITNQTTGSNGLVTSPSYPDNYPPGLRCQWTIESAPGTLVRATFFDLVTQPWFFYFFDYLIVSLDGNWDTFYRFTGDMNRLAPITLESKANRLGVRLATSVDLFNYRGFKMAYVVKPEFDPPPQPGTAVADTPMDGNSSSVIQSGDGGDISALCDYIPVTLPPDSTGDIPIGVAVKIPEKSANPKIIGGSEVTPHQYPFMVAMVFDEAVFCGGSLIDERHVLTAAHCTKGARQIEMYFGVHDMTKNDEPRQYQLVNKTEQIIVHPKYNAFTAANDIAVVRLTHPVHLNAFVQPVYLPSAYSIGNSFRGWNFTTLGWGETNKVYDENAGSIQPILKQGAAPIILNEDCRKTYRNLITGNMICSEGSHTDSPCVGDSGGPLIARFSRPPNTGDNLPSTVTPDGQMHQCVFSRSHRKRGQQEKAKPGDQPTDWYVQVGVVSFGSKVCGSGKPPAYTRVTAYLDFISSAIRKE